MTTVKSVQLIQGHHLELACRLYKADLQGQRHCQGIQGEKKIKPFPEKKKKKKKNSFMVFS